MKISSFFVNNIKYFFVILHRKTCGWHIANPVWGAGLQPLSGYFEEFEEGPEFYSPDADSFCRKFIQKQPPATADCDEPNLYLNGWRAVRPTASG